MDIKQLGLIGQSLSHSFSKKYFEQKFEQNNISGFSYSLYELDDIQKITDLLKNEHLIGLNVTIPYKETVIPFIDELSEEAKTIGAINTIKIIQKNGKPYTKGYNTDAFGFERMIKPFIKPQHERALILGTGGASKAVDYVLKKKGIDTLSVSRTPKDDQIGYDTINDYVMKYHKLIVNCTPIGMAKAIDQAPNINYDELTPQHTLIDLIYNPEETLFLQKGKQYGAVTINGGVMLKQQAEKAWEIWTTKEANNDN